MRITKLSLTNFRSFRATQEIEFAPLTLMFGPNSVGKSSVLMSLFYLQQILEKGRCDPATIEALGDKYVGGFEKLVNGRDTRKSIVIRIDYDKKSRVGSNYSKIRDLLSQTEELSNPSAEPFVELGDITGEADQVGVELEIAWSRQKNTAYIRRYDVYLDDQKIGSLSSDAGLKQPVISNLNFQHPLLVNDSDRAEESGVSQVFSDIDTATVDFSEGHQVPIKARCGALPILNKGLESTLESEDSLITLLISELLANVFVAPLDNLLGILSESLSIGPLRVVPDALHQANPYPEQKDWYSGAAAWDLIGRSTSQRDEINYWLNEVLELGYSLRDKNETVKTAYMGGDDDLDILLNYIEEFGDKGLEVTLSKEDVSENPEAEESRQDVEKLKGFLKETLGKTDDQNSNDIINVKSKTILWDEVNGIEVNSSDIGVGVSQLLPLVVAAVEKSTGIIACEQPELHVHPRVQVGIGDLLTQRREGGSFLIETHSEHMILRVLRRIRESGDGSLPETLQPVSADDVSIVYLEPFSTGVKARRIHIDEDGEFVERWPRGFFTERSEELF